VPDDITPDPEEQKTPQERTVSHILNSLTGAFQATKAALHNVEYFLYLNPLEITTQQSVDLLGKQAKELLGVCEDGKAWLNRVRAFLQAAHDEVVAAQKDSIEAAKIALAVKTMAADKGAEVKEQKPADIEVTGNEDGTVTVSPIKVP
jgi:hypothetical protein